jgi:thymidine kinase
MKIHKIFGPPGSGKTTYLLNLVEQELESGVPSRSIGYFAFTRKAANEARDRAIAKFNELNAETDFPWFRTLHSLAYRCLRVSNNEIMKPEHYREFARQAGLDMSVSTGDEEFVVQTDNPILNEINLARIRGVDLKTHYNNSRIPIEWFHFEYVERAYRHYKYSNNLMDFTDLLEQIVQEPDYLPKLETVIIDEAQDLSRLQWQMVYALAERSNNVYIAGDDDQCQPGHTKILTTDGEVLLKNLDPAIHRLICYDRNGSHVTGYKNGYSFKKARRTYTGKIYTVTTASGHISSYTDNHHCIVRWKPLKEVIHLRVVYLMQKGNNFRIGQCQLFRADGCVHAWVRAHGERADKLWVLRVTESIEESTYYETLWSYLFGIPQTVFKAGASSVLSQKATDKLFSEIPTYPAAMQLFEALDVSFEYPLYERSLISAKRGGSQIFEAHAASLIPSAMRIGVIAGKKIQWENFSLAAKIKTCEVYSLDVEKHHNYFADGVLTHNCVFTWAGADVKAFLSLEGNVKVLQQSYRVPAKIHALANKVVNRIRSRQEKEWHPRTEEGRIFYYEAFEHVNVTQGDWLLLASTNYMLNDLHEWLKSQGLMFERHGQRSISENILTAVLGWEALRKGKAMPMPVVKTIYRFLGAEFVKRGFKTLRDIDPNREYTLTQLQESFGLLTNDIWHKVLTKISDAQRQYIISILRRGAKLNDRAPIKLSTIHGAKGGEADHVLLLTDLSPKFANEYAHNADDVNRLLYVGLTRAKETLHIIRPKSIDRGFRIE